MKRQETNPEFIRFPRPPERPFRVKKFNPEDIIFIIAAVAAVALFWAGFRGQ